jgi:hypothetical protein
MEHDLAGLEAALTRQAPLESALAELCLFRNRYTQELTPTQQEFLTQAIHCTAVLLNDMLGGID